MSNEDTLKFESTLLIIFSYFDEVLGPQILELYPYQHDKDFVNILDIMKTLLDVSTASEDDNWLFLYADQNFASQNIRITVINEEARGGLSDLMMSIVLKPPHPQHISAMAHDWNNVFNLQKLIEKEIYFESNLPKFKNEEDIYNILGSAHTEIVEQFQFYLDSLEPRAHFVQ